MNSRPLANEIQNAFTTRGIEWIFNNLLNWNPLAQNAKVIVQGNSLSVEVVRGLAGFKLIKVSSDKKLTLVELRDLDKKLAKLAPERLTYLVGSGEVQWIWPKRLSSGSASIEISTHSADSLPLHVAQKLAGIHFEESAIREGLTIGIVSAKVRGQFDSSEVTRNFYVEFRRQHSLLSEAIQGLEGEKIKQEYASTLLNRLMFLYFLQKKQFLNGDPDYLRTSLAKLKDLEKRDYFYNFYQHLLTALFFEKLASPSGEVTDPLIAEILGDIKYINGGIFEQSVIEADNAIFIPDEVFVSLFEFFDSYTWHLDTRSTGIQNEINPEVIGYIFEQYINAETASGQKENGAYYTPHDVTSYMSEYTLATRYLDKVIALGFDPLKHVKDSPLLYIKSDNLRGYDFETSSWLPLPSFVAPTIPELAKVDQSTLPRDESLQLSGETWMQTLGRRLATDSTVATLNGVGVSHVNDLITLNLDCVALIRDFHLSLTSSAKFDSLWDALTSLSVIDPTCGSGAFLFAALEHLEIFYSSLMEVAKASTDSTYSFLDLAQSHINEKYFIRKHAALNNLYGTDLMPGAIETAKLRVFLALAACIDDVDHLEPLPDMDLNLKCGNLVIGVYDLQDALRLANEDITFKSLGEAVEEKIDEMKTLYANFLKESNSKDGSASEIKKAFKKEADAVNDIVNALFVEAFSSKASLSHEAWLASRRPLHWFVEFPKIIAAGGFDVVIGNPPYISMKPQKRPFDIHEVAEFSGYKTHRLPDFYAICYERSLQILNSHGRHAFIVMLSLGFSKTFKVLVDLINTEYAGQWWSTYGKDPSGLFAGVKVRNTILVLSKEGKVHQTSHKIISAIERENLFPTLKYYSTTRTSDGQLIRAGAMEPVVRAILDFPRISKQLSGESLHVKVTAAYWFPVMYFPPRILNMDYSLSSKPARTKKLDLLEGENKKMAFALLGSRLGYLVWAAIGDDFDSDAKQGALMLGLLRDLQLEGDLENLAEKIFTSAHEAVYVNHQVGALYPNIRWSSVVEHTREFEERVLKFLELETLMDSLEIWYANAMKSTRPASNNVFFSSKKAKKYLDWG